jgi:hypothetical protein
MAWKRGFDDAGNVAGIDEMKWQKECHFKLGMRLACRVFIYF